MDGSVRQILDPRILSAAYAQIPNDTPMPLTEAWFDPFDKEPIDDDSFRVMYDPADMTPAPGNIIGSEARIITVGNAKEKIYNFAYSFNSTNFEENVMRALREPASYQLQNMGRTEVTRIMNKFRNRQRRFKELWIAKLITQGTVYMNNAGQILESSTNATQTATFEMQASNQGNLGGLMTGLLSNPSTDIPSIIETIDDTAVGLNVPATTDVWVNKLNLQYLRNNNSFKYWAQYNKEASDQVLRGGIINDLWGKTWHFIGTKYTASDGTTKPYIPQTGTGSFVLTPPPGLPWMKVAEGASLLPKDVNIVTDVDEALANIVKTYGPFAYAKLEHNPLRMMAFMGDKFGLFFNDPNAVWQATGF